MAEPTTDDIDVLVGPATPHFAYQLRARIRDLIEDLPPEHPPDATVQLPVNRVILPAVGDPPRPRLDGVHVNHKRVARLSAYDRDRPGQRVPLVEVRPQRLERVLGTEIPAVVRHGEPHDVLRPHLQHRLELAREVPVEHGSIEPQFVQRRLHGDQNASSFRAASTTRSGEGMYASSICQ